MMSTPYARNGHAVYDEDPDWQASLDYANDQERWPQTPRTPCANPDCDQLCVSLFCSESCREATEGPDHDDALASEEEIAAGWDVWNRSWKFGRCRGLKIASPSRSPGQCQLFCHP